MSERFRSGKPEADSWRRSIPPQPLGLCGAGKSDDRAQQPITPRGLGTRELLAEIKVTETGRRHADGVVERVAQAVEKFA